jgi:hypothetical protein
MYGGIRRVAAKEGFPFVVLSVMLFVFHVSIDINFGDDLMFRAAWGAGAVRWLAEMYDTWSSRVIIHLAAIACCVLPQAVWKAANICVMVLAAVCVSKIFVRGADGENAVGSGAVGEGVKYRRTCNTVIVSLFLMYNLYEMSSTGWVASTVNYMWPMAFGLYVLLSVKKAFCREALKKYQYPLTAAALAFAANQEQVCAILLAVYLYYFAGVARAVFFRGEKARVSRFIVLQSFLCAASFACILSCPGNSRRYEYSVDKIFPGYDALTFFEKASMGVSATLNYFVMTPNVLFLVVSLLLSIGIFVKYKNVRARVVSVTPLFVNAVAFAYVFMDYFMAGGRFALKNPRDIFQTYGIAGTGDASRFYVPHILYAAMICAFAACLYMFFNDRKKLFLPACVLLLGISSRAMLGFSPTVFASSYRTYLFLNFAFIITAALIYQDIAGSAKAKTVRWVNALMVMIALANYLAIPVGYQIIKPFFGRP